MESPSVLQELAELKETVKMLLAAQQQSAPDQQSLAAGLDGLSARSLQTSQFDSGDTAWMLMSTVLVFFMTMPGITLYYCGRVREKNVLATVMQMFTITCIITVWWLICGYSFCFGPIVLSNNNNQVFGPVGSHRFWFENMGLDTAHPLAPTVPESVFCMYQLMFAIVTAALIPGSFADRMQYSAMVIFITLWHIVVYCPIAHAVWHPNGFLNAAGVLDYAGGNVVHISAGCAGLMSAVIIGKRRGYGTDNFEPHNLLVTFMGTCMLWMGWFGFNAGSAFRANERAGYALLVSMIAACMGALSWAGSELLATKRTDVLALVHGSIAGLVAITPASGYVDQTGGFFIGLLSGPVCYFGALLKFNLGYDDALDAFGVHAIGGSLGGILTGFFAQASFCGQNGVFYADTTVGGTQLGIQIYGIVVVFAWSCVATGAILLFVDKLVGLRVSASQEDEGLDATIHGDLMELIMPHLMGSAVKKFNAVKNPEQAGEEDFIQGLELGKITSRNSDGVPSSVNSSFSDTRGPGSMSASFRLDDGLHNWVPAVSSSTPPAVDANAPHSATNETTATPPKQL